MAFWDLFENKTAETESINSIHSKLKLKIPNGNEDRLIEIACIAGLFARVAFVDINLDPAELNQIESSIVEWGGFTKREIRIISEIAIEEIKDLSGLENHKYCKHLNDLLSPQQKYHVLQALFAIAASDGTVDNLESEEIRLISKGLNLSHKHYIAARAEVLSKLKVLNI